MTLQPLYADDARPVMATCPTCGREHEDWDGFGVLACIPGCGWCSHPSRDGGVCGICGDVERQCAWCGRMQDAQGVYSGPRVALRTRAADGTTHGICGPCSEAYLAEAEARAEGREA